MNCKPLRRKVIPLETLLFAFLLSYERFIIAMRNIRNDNAQLATPIRVETARGAVDKLREAGEKVGLLRVISAWPFPVKGFAELPESVKNIITVESCVSPQMTEDVMITAKKIKHLRDTNIYSLCSGPVTAKVGEIMDKYYEIKNDPEHSLEMSISNAPEEFNRAEL